MCHMLVRPIYHSNLLHTLHSNQFQFKYKPPSAEALGGNKTPEGLKGTKKYPPKRLATNVQQDCRIQNGKD